MWAHVRTQNLCLRAKIRKTYIPVNPITSRKHLRAKVTPDFHLTYSENGGNLWSESK